MDAKIIISADEDNAKPFVFRKGDKSRVRFQCSATLRGRSAIFLTNYPLDTTTQFSRRPLAPIPLTTTEEGEEVVDLTLVRDGAFEFEVRCGTTSTFGYFHVEPDLRIGTKSVPLDGLMVHTVIPRCLGPLNEWRERLAVSSECGYNMVHFTPVNTIGESGSAYSLSDHLSVDKQLAPGLTQAEAWSQLSTVLDNARKPVEDGGLGLLCVGDVVWNHTASNSIWIAEHPEAGFNLQNSPHLIPAFVLDQGLVEFSDYLDKTNTASIETESDVHTMLNTLKSEWLPKLRLWEFFTINKAFAIKSFSKKIHQEPEQISQEHASLDAVTLTPSWTRRGVTVDVDACIQVLRRNQHGGELTKENADLLTDQFSAYVDKVNLPLYKQLDEDLEAVITNVQNTILWERVDANGPKQGRVTSTNPVMSVSFVRLPNWRETKDPIVLSTFDVDDLVDTRVLACNGWIWGGDPLNNFADATSSAYFRRDVKSWGDSIKLRYGDSPKDSPFLWDYMTKYSQQAGKMFDGLRIDNCHSTPVHVAQHMLDVARQASPDLFMFAELFTNDINLDIAIVAKLGLNALIREAMSAHDVKDLSQLVHEYGGPPIGSFYSHTYHHVNKFAMKKPRALFMDCSHDNELISDKYTHHATIPIIALVSMAACSIGSNRGVDEMLTSKVKVVDETRRYRNHALDGKGSNASLMPTEGIINARKHFNRLHATLLDFSEIYIDLISKHIFTVTRHCPRTHKSYLMIAFPVVHNGVFDETTSLPVINTLGKVNKVALYITQGRQQAADVENVEATYIKGRDWDYQVVADVDVSSIDAVKVEERGPVDSILFHRFCPGSVIVFEVDPQRDSTAAAREMEMMTSNPSKSDVIQRLTEEINALDLVAINSILFRCQAEESEEEHGAGGDYSIPHFGSLTYCGVQGAITVFEKVIRDDGLAHPICDNLRSGDWLMDYTADRLRGIPDLPSKLPDALAHVFGVVKKLHRSVIPSSFCVALFLVHTLIVERALLLLKSASTKHPFGRKLAISSLQFYGLNAVSTRKTAADVHQCSVSAGLPHFSHGWMRTWGRDTFIALRGLFLVLGRAEDAKNVILDFARTLRHGLMPNLFDNGNNPRFNCRDAAWWFLQAVQDFTTMTEDGVKILNEPVTRRFASDAMYIEEPSNTTTVPLSEIIQEILQRHVEGIHFREWHAGPKIDDKMTSDGFNVDIRFDRGTGFIYGGQKSNCGTWMDKMGESKNANNYGVPATPRDGADVEIIGLVKSTVSWLARLNAQNIFKYDGVDCNGGEHLKFSDWGEVLQTSFEKYFWVPETKQEDGSYQVDSKMVHRRGMYKDVVGSIDVYTDYQLRPNFCIAMVVAPELFDKSHARIALKQAEKLLVGGLGMRTLDPGDLNYRPNYHNGVDSTDYFTSRGFNYHQGPEWLWPVGYFLRAKFAFTQDKSSERKLIHEFMSRYDSVLQHSDWKGLPEIFNEHGAHNADGCPTQAWSVSCLLDVVYDLTN
eukprot:m.120406 g.120406  ORF g.120406 m.120406 type:complete len:1491 (+) comp28801_c0_seq1:247-4719(+)